MYKAKDRDLLMATLTGYIKNEKPSDEDAKTFENLNPKHLLGQEDDYGYVRYISLKILREYRKSSNDPQGVPEEHWNRIKSWLTEINPELIIFTSSELEEISKKEDKLERKSKKKEVSQDEFYDTIVYTEYGKAIDMKRLEQDGFLTRASFNSNDAWVKYLKSIDLMPERPEDHPVTPAT